MLPLETGRVIPASKAGMLPLAAEGDPVVEACERSTEEGFGEVVEGWVKRMDEGQRRGNAAAAGPG